MTAPAQTEIKTPTWTGQSLPRKEDERLLKAQGAFVDDEGIYRMGYAHFVRSPKSFPLMSAKPRLWAGSSPPSPVMRSRR